MINKNLNICNKGGVVVGELEREKLLGGGGTAEKNESCEFLGEYVQGRGEGQTRNRAHPCRRRAMVCCVVTRPNK